MSVRVGPGNGSLSVPGDPMRAEIERVRAEIADLERIWGETAALPHEARRIEDALTERHFRASALLYRADQVQRQAENLKEQVRSVRQEIKGLQRGLMAILGEVLEEASSWTRPFWSPMPILGYRIWEVCLDGLRGGAGFRWDNPRLEAQCGPDGKTGDPEVPHIRGECGIPPCGIYVLKDLKRLLRFQVWRLSRSGLGVVVGLTALTGRVVEHESGYRAQRARVVAAALLHRADVHASTDPTWIGTLFRSPVGPVASKDPARVRRFPSGKDAGSRLSEFFDRTEREERARWTSASRNE